MKKMAMQWNNREAIRQKSNSHTFVDGADFFIKLQLHCHDFGHDGATTHPDLSSRDASA